MKKDKINSSNKNNNKKIENDKNKNNNKTKNKDNNQNDNIKKKKNKHSNSINYQDNKLSLSNSITENEENIPIIYNKDNNSSLVDLEINTKKDELRKYEELIKKYEEEENKYLILKKDRENKEKSYNEMIKIKEEKILAQDRQFNQFKEKYEKEKDLLKNKVDFMKEEISKLEKVKKKNPIRIIFIKRRKS